MGMAAQELVGSRKLGADLRGRAPRLLALAFGLAQHLPCFVSRLVSLAASLTRLHSLLLELRRAPRGLLALLPQLRKLALELLLLLCQKLRERALKLLQAARILPLLALLLGGR